MSICGNCYFILTLLGVCHETVNLFFPLKVLPPHGVWVTEVRIVGDRTMNKKWQNSITRYSGRGDLRVLMRACLSAGSRLAGIFVQAMVLSGLTTMCVLCTIAARRDRRKMKTTRKKNVMSGVKPIKTTKGQATQCGVDKVDPQKASGAAVEPGAAKEHGRDADVETEETPVVGIVLPQRSDETGKIHD